MELTGEGLKIMMVHDYSDGRLKEIIIFDRQRSTIVAVEGVLDFLIATASSTSLVVVSHGFDNTLIDVGPVYQTTL